MQPLVKAPGGMDVRHSSAYQDVKARIHEQLLNRLNLERLRQIRRDEAEPELRSVIGSLLEKESETTPLNLQERETIVVDVLNELFGLGPLEALLLDPEISDILVNRFDQIYIEKNGVLEPVSAVFQGRPPSDAHHRAHRQHRGTPHRRIESHGGRAPAGRVARERHHSAAGARRPRALDPAIPNGQAERRRPRQGAVDHRADDRVSQSGRRLSA